MRRVAATAVHLTLCVAGGVLYFLFVLPRWWELMGDTSHNLGTVARIVCGALIALAALPVALSLVRARKPENPTPALALQLRLCSVVAHVLAGVLIAGTAVAEIWLSLDDAGRWLFGIYGGAAAIAILGIGAFYLSFLAEQPPKPPKPPKVKKEKRRGRKRDEAVSDETARSDEAVGTTAGARETGTDGTEPADETEPTPAEVTAADSEAGTPQEQPEPVAGGLRNKRPTGKTSHRLRRRNLGEVVVEEQ